MTITDLPPTSYATEGHIQRAFYATYMQVNCLGDFSLNHGVAAILAAILEFTITRYFFHPENDFNGFLDTKNLGRDTKFITPGQIQMELYGVYG